jgi:peptidoglycan/LPS O-acetylase OafA/YrhL
MGPVLAPPRPGRPRGPSYGPRRTTHPTRSLARPAAAPRDRGDSSEREGFRPDLEGLRAVAVGLVLLFHAGVPFVAGGYVGVDVFFVLSGFLITGLIVRELERTGTVSLVGFYARRARRLLPAAFVALVATMVASAIFLPPLSVPDVAGDGFAAALYVSNMRFAFQATDYLQSAQAPSPLLHYWSLAVEEQFYLFWPALVLLVTRGGRVTIGRLAAVVAIVFGASLVLSIVLTGIAQPWAFFTLPARAWELALGAGLALAAWRGFLVPRGLAAPIGLAGLACIVASGLVLDRFTPFPGTAALLPTAGAALVIAAGLRPPGAVNPASWIPRARSMVSVAGGVPIHARLLSLPPVRWLGRISYSLYLWHWPILVIPVAAREAPLPWPARLALAGVSVVVAALSQRFIEEPFRHGRVIGFRPARTLAAAGIATLAATIFSAGLLPAGPLAAPYGLAGSGAVNAQTIAADVDAALGTPPTGPTPTPRPASSVKPVLPKTPGGGVPTNLTPSLAQARNDLPPIYDDGCHLTYAAVNFGPCVYGDTGSSTTVVLFGDSHAAQWFPALVQAAMTYQWRLLSFTKSACAPADVAIWDPSLNRVYTECEAWRTAVLKRIATERPALVVVSMSRGYTLAINGQAASLATHRSVLRAALTRTLQSLSAISAHVALIEETPHQRLDPPVCLSAHRNDVRACSSPLSRAINSPFRNLEVRAGKAAAVNLIDATAWICPTDPCPVVIGHVLVYRDMHHMTQTFNQALSAYLVAALPKLGP